MKKQQDEDDRRTEIANHVYGDFLTENPAAAQSAFGSHRVIPDRWKGMSPEQIAEIRRQQDIQRKEAEVCGAGIRSLKYAIGINNKVLRLLRIA